MTPSIAFLNDWFHDIPGYAQIAAIFPDSGKIIVWSHDVATIAQLESVIEQHGQFTNIYFTPNPLKQDLNRKAGKTDIGFMSCLCADIDPRDGHVLDEERKRILQVIESFPLKPNAVVDSGNGYQCFWRLAEPIAVNGNAAELERYNKALADALGGDHCWSLEHLMRLPGTTNFPNEAKLAKGRAICPAVLVHQDDGSYKLEDFDFLFDATNPTGGRGSQRKPVLTMTPAQAKSQLTRLNISPSMKKSIQEGTVKGKRSEAVCGAIEAMLVGGHTPDIIVEVLMHPANGLSERPREKGIGKLEKEIEHAQTALDELIIEMNNKHAVVNLSGRAVILTEVVSAATDHPEIQFSQSDDIHTLCRKRKVGGKRLVDYWMEHPSCRLYAKGIVFDPKHLLIQGYYNLWKGFAVKPKEGNCELYLAHIRDNICQGDQAKYDWLIAWMAEAVQLPGNQPADKPGVALALRGQQGTGKSLFATIFGSLFGPHFVTVSNGKHLTGSFNAHLASAFLVLSEEAFWAGDKSAEGVLKDLTTSPTMRIEYKGQNVITVANHIRLIVCSNNDWVVPAGESERRFCVFDVGEGKMQDATYFKAMIDQMNNGGREALLYLLQHYDLSKVNLRDFPKTTALLEQKLQGLHSFDQYWFNCLKRGLQIGEMGEWQSQVEKDEIYEEYLCKAGRQGINRKAADTEIGIRFKKLVPGLKSKQATVAKPVRFGSGSETIKRRVWVWEFPPLAECRKHFEDVMGQPIDWELQ
ncbi:hypothetical protein SAMN04515618_11798 [Collimonas sp. OK307]|uniref:DUF5906 domain-containing protein n=1 Tax=Collimonas sp. OK307 TaxID=1801620 RepID=UPI0008EBACD3|nr:DUF5906 domain-containing protein [Collimonas sp. OK307]SFI32876.1 hypothetical protein SAMN04515618_11798 [Collimonas sp. OK307]